MIEALIDAVTLDQFLIALVGQFANDATAKLTFTTVKAVGVAMLGAVARPLSVQPKRPQVRTVRRQMKQKKSQRKVPKTKVKYGAQSRSRSRN